MTSNPLFLDLMMRLQFSRLSLRVHYEQREFVGERPSFVRPETANAQARLDYTGWRLGTDIEFAYWNRSRVGISADWDTYPAIFSQSIDTFVPTRIQARGIITIGGHATYNPVTSFYGVTGLLEGSMRWAVTKTTMTDLELSWGVKLPETILGAIGIKSGYRRTTLGFRDSHRDFDITFQGWFGEVVYYY